MLIDSLGRHLVGHNHNRSHRERAVIMQDSITESKIINYILFMVFSDVAVYLLKKEVEKIRLQVLFRL
jgi:hypothetical protein